MELVFQLLSSSVGNKNFTVGKYGFKFLCFPSDVRILMPVDCPLTRIIQVTGNGFPKCNRRNYVRCANKVNVFDFSKFVSWKARQTHRETLQPIPFLRCVSACFVAKDEQRNCGSRIFSTGLYPVDVWCKNVFGFL